MNSSFLYHAWGLYQHKCLREEYKGNTFLLHIESKRAPKCCPKYGFRDERFFELRLYALHDCCITPNVG